MYLIAVLLARVAPCAGLTELSAAYDARNVREYFLGRPVALAARSLTLARVAASTGGSLGAAFLSSPPSTPVSYTHLTLPTKRIV